MIAIGVLWRTGSARASRAAFGALAESPPRPRRPYFRPPSLHPGRRREFAPDIAIDSSQNLLCPQGWPAGRRPEHATGRRLAMAWQGRVRSPASDMGSRSAGLNVERRMFTHFHSPSRLTAPKRSGYGGLGEDESIFNPPSSILVSRPFPHLQHWALNVEC